MDICHIPRFTHAPRFRPQSPRSKSPSNRVNAAIPFKLQAINTATLFRDNRNIGLDGNNQRHRQTDRQADRQSGRLVSRAASDKFAHEPRSFGGLIKIEQCPRVCLSSSSFLSRGRFLVFLVARVLFFRRESRCVPGFSRLSPSAEPALRAVDSARATAAAAAARVK